MSKSTKSVYKITFAGVMAAIVFVVTFFRFPLLGSKVHLANAMCLLSGLLLGSATGGLAAGLGSALYDTMFGGYGFVEIMITFVSKFLMAFICAKIAGTDRQPSSAVRTVIASIIGAFSYVGLYMAKTFVYQKFVYGYAADAVKVTLLAKLPASLINAVVAMVVAPILYKVLEPALRKANVLLTD